jgi:peroxiredoxin
LQSLHKHFLQDPFVLLAVDVEEEASMVKSFARNRGLSFPILLDSNGAVAREYGVRNHPVAFLIDTEGNVLGRAVGYREWDRKEMKALISSLMPRVES